MIKTILLCVDGSKYSTAATEASLWLSKHLKSTLHVLSVVDTSLLEGPWLADLSGVAGVQPFQSLVPQLRELYKNKANIAVETALKMAKHQNISCTTEVRVGSVINEILGAERTSELVVLGQRGEAFESTGEWLGTIVERVVRKSIKPCLITPSEFRPIKSVLATYDGSEHSNHALYVACDLVKLLKARLTIITVEGMNSEEKTPWALKEGLEIAQKQGVTVSPMALHGSPEDKILELASGGQFDLVVMGAYGHTRLRELVLGSVTTRVIQKSPIPVLLTR
jgi:nucleotide-binding universal stress UspA family protein